MQKPISDANFEELLLIIESSFFTEDQLDQLYDVVMTADTIEKVKQ